MSRTCFVAEISRLWGCRRAQRVIMSSTRIITDHGPHPTQNFRHETKTNITVHVSRDKREEKTTTSQHARVNVVGAVLSVNQSIYPSIEHEGHCPARPLFMSEWPKGHYQWSPQWRPWQQQYSCCYYYYYYAESPEEKSTFVDFVCLAGTTRVQQWTKEWHCRVQG